MLQLIAKRYSNVSARWILLGEMPIFVDPHDDTTNIAEEPFCKYTPSPPPCEKCKLKDELIESLRHDIATQDKYIARLESEIQSPQSDGQKRKAQ